MSALHSLALLIVLASCSSVRDVARIERVHALLESARAEHGFPGCVTAFAFRDGEVHTVAIGHVDAERATPMTADAWMLSGSIGKSYLGLVAARLAAAGEIDLDAKLVETLPDAAWLAGLPNHEQLTLRILLRHQSGLADHVHDRAFQKALLGDPDRAWTAVDLLAYERDTRPMFEAGTRWAYADTNHVVAGLAIETITKRTWDELLRALVLEPLELKETRPSDARVLPGLVQGHASGLILHKGPVLDAGGRYFVNPDFEDRGGGLCCTTRDLARFCRALFTSPAIEGDARAVMLDAVVTKSRVCERYGLGLMFDTSAHGPRIGHSGFMPGYLSRMSWYPELELAVAIQFDTDDLRSLGASVEAWTDRIAAALTDGD
ncbi:MAG: beta-lactamase family protein [Planctomycetes bacterium]|nr:beta-lactamase family protein [Planctomycetota bacterium]